MSIIIIYQEAAYPVVKRKFLFFFFSVFGYRMAYRILVPQIRTEPGFTAIKDLSPNHWTTREFPKGGL